MRDSEIDDPNQAFKRWALGAVGPVGLAFTGVQGLILKTAVIAGNHTHFVVHGAEAVAVSLANLSLAFFLHFYFFWEGSDRMAGYRELLSIAGLICFLAAVGYFVFLDFRI